MKILRFFSLQFLLVFVLMSSGVVSSMSGPMSFGWEILKSENFPYLEDNKTIVATNALKSFKLDKRFSRAACLIEKISKDVIVFQLPYISQEGAYCASSMVVGTNVLGKSKNLEHLYNNLLGCGNQNGLASVKKALGEWADCDKILPYVSGQKLDVFGYLQRSLRITGTSSIYGKDLCASVLMLPTDITKWSVKDHNGKRVFSSSSKKELEKAEKIAKIERCKFLKGCLDNKKSMTLFSDSGIETRSLTRFKNHNNTLPELFMVRCGSLQSRIGHWFAVRMERMPNGMIAILFADSCLYGYNGTGSLVNKIDTYRDCFVSLGEVLQI